MKPIAIDLFCGKGAWTNALLEAGFEVHGFDIEPQPDYKGDIRAVRHSSPYSERSEAVWSILRYVQ